MATSLTSTGVTFPDSTTQTTAATSAGGTLEAVASGALSTGDMVVVNTDGTVSVVEQTFDPTTGVGSAANFSNSQQASFYGAAYDSANSKVVIAYRDNSNNYGKAVVGTVSGTSISFGTPVTFSASSTQYCGVGFDSTNGKIVIAYRDAGNNYYGTAIVGTVSGTSISFGSPTVYASVEATWNPVAYDVANQKVVIAYQDGNTSPTNQGRAVVGTVSGTSISFGSTVQFNSGVTYDVTSVYDSANQKVILAYRDASNNGYGTAIVGTVSGTSISFGSESVFNSGVSIRPGITYDSTNSKVVIAYQNSDSADYGEAVVGTVSGTSISFGTPVEFNLTTTATNQYSVAYSPELNQVIIGYTTGAATPAERIKIGTVSGTSISFSNTLVVNNTTSDSTCVVYDSANQKFVTVWRDGSGSYLGYANVITTGTLSANLTAENFVGVSDGNYSDTDTATILIAGSVSDAQSGLTAGQSYYVQKDGTLSTTPDDPSVFAGTSISSTKLIVQG